MIVLLICTA